MTTSDGGPRLPPWAPRLFAVLLVAGGLLAAYHFGIFASFAEPARAARTVADLGVAGYLAFVLAYAALQPFGVPGTVFIIAAALIWPWPVAFVLSMIGTMAASVVGFSFCRFVARDFVARRIPERFKTYEDALARRAFTTVLVMRLVFWMPPLLHAFFGVSKVRFSTHFWGSLLGYIPPLLLVSYFGQRLFDALSSGSLTLWLGMLAASAVIITSIWFWQRRFAATDD